MHSASPDLLDRLFSVSGGIVAPIWLLLIFFPAWRWTQRLATFAVPLFLGSLYVGLLATAAGWIHYLAFDLFTGAWEARDAATLGISRWLVGPCLVLTFLFGPLGLGLYLVLRLALRRRVGVVPELPSKNLV